MTEYYKDMFEPALQYQDFVIEQLRKANPCIIVPTYSSKKYQFEHGESACGIEIKHDIKFEKGSPNLYIEIAEKSSAAIAEFTPSGIFRNDNSWLYLIGSYSEAFLFSKKQLQSIYESRGSWDKRGIREADGKDPDGNVTSKGFLYPVESAIANLTVLYHFKFA